MDLDDQSVSTRRDGCLGHGGDQARVARAVAGVDDDRQMSPLLYVGDRGQRESEARVALEGANAALAEHDVLDCRRRGCIPPRVENSSMVALGPRLRRHRPRGFAHGLEQAVVLHIACTDLQDVGIFAHEVYVVG